MMNSDDDEFSQLTFIKNVTILPFFLEDIFNT